MAAQALGLNKIVSEDSVRRALKAIEPQAAQTWMHRGLAGLQRGHDAIAAGHTRTERALAGGSRC